MLYYTIFIYIKFFYIIVSSQLISSYYFILILHCIKFILFYITLII